MSDQTIEGFDEMSDLNEQHLLGIFAKTAPKTYELKNRLICIEGNIGIGKSTLTKILAEKMQARPMFEPVGENPYLDAFYKDPKRYALEMQFWLMSRRFEMHEQAIRHIWHTGQSVIMDRSIYGDWIFAKKNWQDGNIDDIGYASYCKHREVMDRYLLAPHIVLFLQAQPKTCLDRIQSRGRDCEKEIPITYLQGLYKLHDELAMDMRKRGSKIIDLNWEKFEPVDDAFVEKLRTS